MTLRKINLQNTEQPHLVIFTARSQLRLRIFRTRQICKQITMLVLLPAMMPGMAVNILLPLSQKNLIFHNSITLRISAGADCIVLI